MNQNHIGEKNWRRLTPKQKRRIITNRAQGRKIFEGIQKAKYPWMTNSYVKEEAKP